MIKKSNWKQDIVPYCIVIFMYIILYILGIGCPIKFLTGISCPGCGMTRAWNCVIHGHIDEAFNYHPLFMIVPVVIGIKINEVKINSKALNVIYIAIAALIVSVYVIRMLSITDSTVTFNIKDGFILRNIMEILKNV